MEWIFDNFFVILHPVNRLYHALIREIQLLPQVWQQAF